MSDINVQLKHNGTTFTDDVVSYQRDWNICSGVCALNVVVKGNTSRNFGTWDTILLYEDGIKKGTFFVSDIIKAEGEGTKTINCQDGSKRAMDYFVADTYQPTGMTYAKYWIEKFLDEAGISYSFTVADDGAPVNENTQFGPAGVYEMVVPLLQASGWYMYFDKDNDAIIGKLDVNLSNYKKKLNDSDIISIETHKDDTMLRNRAVVWGNANYVSGTQVFSDISVHTPWNIDTTDKRAVVVANSYIENNTVANELATKMLKEFARITYTKTVKLAGAYNLQLGDIVFVNSKYYRGTGLITSLMSTVDSGGGLTTTLILDERCPRIFGYYNYNGYVYIGTWGNGVWRKPLAVDLWEDFSTGLENLDILDLYINNGLFVCVANDGYAYTRDITDTTWTKYSHGAFIDDSSTSIPEANIKALVCTINTIDNKIYIGYAKQSDPVCAWLVELNPQFEEDRHSQMICNSNYRLTLVDIDTDDQKVFATFGNSTYSYPDSCGEYFTTNNLDNWTESFASNFEAQQSTPYICGGKVYYASQLASDHTKLKIYIKDFRFPTVTTTESAALSFLGDYLGTMLVKDGIGYITIQSFTDTYIYSYDFSTLAWSLKETVAGLWAPYKRTLTRLVTEVTATTIDKALYYHDIINGASGDVSITIIKKDATSVNFGSYYFDKNKIIYEYVYGGYNSKFAWDNATTGCLLGPSGQDYGDSRLIITTYTLTITCNDGDYPVISPSSSDIFTTNTSHFDSFEFKHVGACFPYNSPNSTNRYSIYALDKGYWVDNPDFPPGNPCTYQYPSGEELTLFWNTDIAGTKDGYGKYDLISYGSVLIASSHLIQYIPFDTAGNVVGGTFGLFEVGADDDTKYMDYLSGHFYYIHHNIDGEYYLVKRNLYTSEETSIYLTTVSLYVDDDIPGTNIQGENLFGIQRFIGYGPLDVRAAWIFYKFGDWSNEIEYNLVAREEAEDGVFTQVDITVAPHKLEISQNYPITHYDPTNLRISQNDTVDTYADYNLSPMTNMNDIRVFDLSYLDPVDTLDGIILPQATRYVGVVSGGDLYIRCPDYDRIWNYYATFGDVVGRFETSNNGSIPHMFVTTSGSGVYKFFQRLTDETAFYEHNTNLPSSLVTIIRVDDIL